MRFMVRTLRQDDIDFIAGWRYAAPYDVYDEREPLAPDADCRVLEDAHGVLFGYFCWGEGARVSAASDLYERDAHCLDFGIAMRPDRTGEGYGLFACEAALEWLRGAFSPSCFRLAVYEWNTRAQRVYARLGFVPQTARGGFILMTKDERAWIDVTRPLENGMPVYPTDPDFDRHLLYRKEDCGWDLSVFAMSAHTGTHLDAPAHIGLVGDTESIAVDRLNGTAQLIPWGPGAAGQVRSPRVLLQTDGRGLRLAEAEQLLDTGVTLLATNAMSVGEGEDERGVHRMLLEAGVAVIENAALEGLPAGWYEMRCLPLRMPGSDGSPVRMRLRREAP